MEENIMMNERQVGDQWRGDWRTFTDPVIAADGYTYDREKIEKWLQEGNTVSPTTGKELESKELVSNRALRDLSDAIKKKADIEAVLSNDPITLEIPKDPVVAKDGYTYDRASIVDWLKKNPTSPSTREPLASQDLIPNLDYLAAIAEFNKTATKTAKIDEEPQQGDWHTFTEPVIAADGRTHERETIDPTGEKLKSKALVPNIALKKLIEKEKAGGKIEEDDLTDPITLVIMTDPVVTADGQTYDRSTIEEWLKTHDTSPLTGATLPSKDLIPNLEFKGVIDRFTEAKAAKKDEEPPVSPPKHSWITSQQTFNPQQKKSAEKWLAEVRSDAKKQTDPEKRTLLLELAQNTTALLKASSKPNHSEAEIAEAKTKLGQTITKVEKMDGNFAHTEKGKYSPKKIALAIATMGISITIVGVREKKTVEKTGQEVTSKLDDVIERPKPH
jgi:hypothetical protein